MRFVEPLLVVLAAWRVASAARRRGVDPWFYGILVACAWLLGAMTIRASFGDSIVGLLAPWTLVAAVAFFLRFTGKVDDRAGLLQRPADDRHPQERGAPGEDEIPR